MIRIVEKVVYLPKGSKNELIDYNEMWNEAAKQVASEIKKDLSRISTSQNANLSLTIKVLKDGKFDISCSITPEEDTDLKNQVAQVLQKYGYSK